MSENPARRKKKSTKSKEQEFAVGKPLAEDHRLALGGFCNVPMLVDPTNLTAIVMGRQGRGKSSLVQSCLGGYVFNFDGSSTPRKPLAIVWPGKRKDGSLVEIDPTAKNPNEPQQGKVIEMTWKAALEKKDILLQLARDDVPGRPRICFMDRIDSAQTLCKQWMVEQWNEEHPDNQKDDFHDIGVGGQYPELYAHIIDFGFELHTAGYGFVWVIPIGDRTISLGDRNKEYLHDTQTGIYENLWNQLNGMVELIAFLDFQKVPEKRRVKKEGGGYRRERTGKHINQLVMYFDTTVHADVKKRYHHIPEKIVIPRDRPWQTFEDAINKAIEIEANEA